MKRITVLAASAAVILSLVGCAVTNDTTVLVGKARPPTNPDQVKLYFKPPAKYEHIALVSSDSAHDFMSKQALADLTMKNFKEQAARVGANGILIEGVGDFYTGSSGVMVMPAASGGVSVGTGAMNARTGKKASGMAIFVTEE